MGSSGNYEKCLTGLVKGRVQGVFFRVETRAAAMKLGVVGWVRNTPDGHVEVLICGSRKAVSALQEWLRQGPPLAQVERLQLHECEDCELMLPAAFEIRH